MDKNKRWREIESGYWISDHGDIYSEYKKGHMAHEIVWSGYHRVGIRDKHLSVHRLVAKHFIDNDDHIRKIQINHMDGNKDNNVYTNLEWVTSSENNKHAVREGLRSVVVPVVVKDVKTGDVHKFPSIPEASKFLSIPNDTVLLEPVRCEYRLLYGKYKVEIDLSSIEDIESKLNLKPTLYAYDLVNDKLLEFTKFNQIAYKLGIPQTNVIKPLKKRPYVYTCGYLFAFTKDGINEHLKEVKIKHSGPLQDRIKLLSRDTIKQFKTFKLMDMVTKEIHEIDGNGKVAEFINKNRPHLPRPVTKAILHNTISNSRGKGYMLLLGGYKIMLPDIQDVKYKPYHIMNSLLLKKLDLKLYYYKDGGHDGLVSGTPDLAKLLVRVDNVYANMAFAVINRNLPKNNLPKQGIEFTATDLKESGTMEDVKKIANGEWKLIEI